MKCLAILDGHSDDGITAGYMQEVLNNLPEDAEYEVLYIPDYDIHHDTEDKRCEALDLIEEKMQAADNILVVCPTYWSSVPGKMKYFLDCMRFRIVNVTHKLENIPDKYKDKHYVIMTSCFVSAKENMFSGVTDETFKIIDRVFQAAGMIKVAEFVAPNTFEQRKLTDAKKEECKKIAQKISQSIEKDNNLMKRYIALFFMVAISSLVTMGLQQLTFHVFDSFVNFVKFYSSFVLIFYLLLSVVLHYAAILKHKRK